MAKSNNATKGRIAEDAACAYLEKQHYTIIERNWRFSRAELDIIAKDPVGILVFVEVKSRSYISFGMPEESISPYKENLIVDAASQYVIMLEHAGEIRFDIITVLFEDTSIASLHHFPDAFFPGIS